MRVLVSLLCVGIWLGWAPASARAAEQDAFLSSTDATGTLQNAPDDWQALDQTAPLAFGDDERVDEPSGFSDLLPFLFDGFDAQNGQNSLPELNQLDLTVFELPMHTGPEVQRWLEFFTGRGRRTYTAWLARSARYLPLIQEELQAAGLPRELAFVAMIESGFVHHTSSPMGAAGMWQFMPRTARAEGLTVQSWVDERRDPVKATRAAARHFEMLYRRFGDWHLALAAYNAGAGRVSGAIDRYNTHDYWSLVRRRALSPETCNYVPRLLAAALIAEYPEWFGFYEVPYLDPLQFQTVTVRGTVSLPFMAAQLGVDVELLTTLNPELVRRQTPPGAYELRLPLQAPVEMLQLALQTPASPEFRQHRVVRGQTLQQLARRYGTSVKELKRLNGLRSDRVQQGDLLTIPQLNQPLERTPETSQETALARASYPTQEEVSLGMASMRSSETSAELPPEPVASELEGEKSTAAAGRALASFRPQTDSAQRDAGARENRLHRVKRGETLSQIARRYEVTIKELKALNNLRDAHALALGQTLYIPTR